MIKIYHSVLFSELDIRWSHFTDEERRLRNVEWLAQELVEPWL
jgi:hypothetical protein